MIQIAKSSKFLRAYKRLIKGRPELQKIFQERIVLFMSNPYHPSLETHRLGGQLKNSWAFSLTYGLRVIFSFQNSNSVILENIGSHDNMY